MQVVVMHPMAFVYFIYAQFTVRLANLEPARNSSRCPSALGLFIVMISQRELTLYSARSRVEQEGDGAIGAGDKADHAKDDRGALKKELRRVRGLCRVKGAILALVEW